MFLALHITAAFFALISGAFQLAMPKGTKQHKFIGRFWMLAMTVTALSSFALKGFDPVIGSLSVIHFLSIWVLICVAASIYFAKVGNIKRHKNFAVGAFYGLVGAGFGTLAPGRLIHEWLFNLF
ncbi:DUF2306 domain-containing protein [Marinomonas sp. C2222]|uniref:DUF2306 domain-containing protein n=1 Tax=Marinomonas sargassi TaxID=2984494 RepID=A0ABT2YPP4_9GAMM|nr:DUF2306 domain-containing protein [Marinomonas sargassi]MCV2401863.1 DUF2306 domain-containing protein [Marinomonas sargassi]